MFYRFRLHGIVSLFFVCSLLSAQQADTPAAPYRSDPKFLDAMKQAALLEHQKRGSFAEDEYKKANKIAQGRCVECLHGMYRMQMGLGEDKDAIATANALLAIDTDQRVRSADHVDLAEALLAKAGSKPKPEQLDAVHATLQQAVSDNPANAGAYYLDGQVLARMGRMEDAGAAFRKCLDHCRVNDPSRLRAEHFAENPELALHKMAPAFEVTALDGSRFNLDAMGGRVVLIDFWAT